MDEKLFADVDVYINSLFASEDPAVREGKVLDPSSDDPAVQGVRRLNQALATDPRVSATILANVGLKKYDGMAIALVR
jgi:predicted O-methyltransferase YrrM